jgi:hypothetical protein
MNLSRSVIACALPFICSLAAAETAKVNSVLDMSELVQDRQISKQFTLDVANAMPAELYDFKPNAADMSFGEQMVHIAASHGYRFNEITGIKMPFPLDRDKPLPSDEQSVLTMLNQSFD